MALDKDVRDARGEGHRADTKVPADLMAEEEMTPEEYEAWEAEVVQEMLRAEAEVDAGQAKTYSLEEVMADVRALLASR